MATDAGKMACYAPMHSGVRMRFGDLEQCLDAAVTGEWRSVKREACCVNEADALSRLSDRRQKAGLEAIVKPMA